MARSRNIKPGFFTNDVLGEMHPLSRLLFAGLWVIADREGRVEDRPRKIRAEVMPYDDFDADKHLTSLAEAGFISRYEAEGVKVIQVLAWEKHQNPHVKEAPSSLPAQFKHQTRTVQAPDNAQPLPERAGLIPSSLIPDSLSPDSLPLIPDSLVGAAKPAAQAPAAVAPATRGTRLNADWALPKAWGEWALSEFPAWTAEKVRTEAAKFGDYWHSKSGKDATKTDWLATWRNWCRSDTAQAGVRRPAVIPIDREARDAEARALLGFQPLASAAPNPLEAING